MSVVPSDLYVALLDLGAEHDEAVAISQAIPSYYAERLGPPMRALAQRSRKRLEDIERRLTELETEWGP
jgi:hypothetical protein